MCGHKQTAAVSMAINKQQLYAWLHKELQCIDEHQFAQAYRPWWVFNSTPSRSIGLYFWGVRSSWAECHFLFSLVYQLCLAL